MSRLLSELYQLKGAFGLRPFGFSRASRSMVECIALNRESSSLDLTDESLHMDSIKSIKDADDNVDLDLACMSGIFITMYGIQTSPTIQCIGLGILGMTGAYVGLSRQSQNLIDQAYAQCQIPRSRVDMD